MYVYTICLVSFRIYVELNFERHFSIKFNDSVEECMYDINMLSIMKCEKFFRKQIRQLMITKCSICIMQERKIYFPEGLKFRRQDTYCRH